MKKLLILILLLGACVNILHAEPLSKKIYFEGSDYELEVYEIKGRQDGNTMLIVGGIQGDEPGGFLSADLYTDMRLEKGNLIVIPRANLKSVLLFDRGPEGDMNRLFTDDIKNTPMEEVVKVLIAYMEKADIFLNLHDGWGFHSTEYVNEQRNNKRFGQSIIVDEDVYECSGKSLMLKDMAAAVLSGVNGRIDNNNHHLAYFNTNTSNPNTKFQSMKKTATWYALRNFCIPAFGIEASKNLNSVELKVLYHNYAVNEFMKLMDIVPETPVLYNMPAQLNEVLIKVNGKSLFVNNGDIIKLNKYDRVSVVNIDSNYSLGVYCDILGYGTMNDLNKEFSIDYSTKIVFRKDSNKFAEITLDVYDGSADANVVQAGYRFLVTVDGVAKSVSAGQTLEVVKGSVIRLINLENKGKNTNLPVNLRGWVPPVAVNSGDDRGYDINTATEEFLDRFSVRKNTFPVTVDGSSGKEIARFFILIKDK